MLEDHDTPGAMTGHIGIAKSPRQAVAENIFELRPAPVQVILQVGFLVSSNFSNVPNSVEFFTPLLGYFHVK